MAPLAVHAMMPKRVVGALRKEFLGAVKKSTTLEAELRRITDKDNIDVHPDRLATVAQASYSAEDRHIIMRHILERLGEAACRRWRKLYTAMLLLEHLLAQGSSDLVTEMGAGVHFDLVQRLALLASFSCPGDQRVETVIQAKASHLHAALATRCDEPLASPSLTARQRNLRSGDDTESDEEASPVVALWARAARDEEAADEATPRPVIIGRPFGKLSPMPADCTDSPAKRPRVGPASAEEAAGDESHRPVIIGHRWGGLSPMPETP